MVRKVLVGAILSGALMVGAGRAHGQIIVNGGFEQPSVVFQRISAGDPSLVGWTIVSGDIEVLNNTFWDPYQGSQSIDLDGLTPGTIQQEIETAIGETYTFSFAYANNPLGAATVPATADVTVTGSSSLLSQSISHSTSLPFAMDYTVFTGQFVADSNSTVIRFASTDPPTSVGGIVLDAVSIQVGVAPEPGTLALMGLAALTLVGLVRRRPA